MNSPEDDILTEFLVESFALLDEARDAISQAQQAPDQCAAYIDSTLRAIHTVKGNSAMFDFAATSHAAHLLEDRLTALKADGAGITPELGLELLSAVDELDDLLHGRDQPAGAAALPLDEGTGASSEGKPAAARPATPNAAREMLRIPLHRVNESLSHIWEIFLIRNQMAYLFAQHKDALRGQHEFTQAWEVLDNALRRNVSELEGKAMAMRMQPIRVVYDRVEKAVRSYISSHDKQIRLERVGDDVDVDKRVVDTLTEPMIHLVRNALDHGIESPAEREAAGKPPGGTITIRSRIVGERVEIVIEDDGHGMDATRILEKARSKGIDVSGVQTEGEIFDLIFLPGFSTAEQVSDVSGRGVGMDVVRTSVSELRGSVSVETELGRGTSFLISLPLSLSVINAIVFNAGGRMFAAGIANVLEVCRVDPSSLQANGGETYFLLRDSFIPCLDLRTMLRSEPPEDEPIATLVILSLGDKTVAVRVDEVLSNTELVAKPTPPHAQDVPYVSGISILQTGTPLFILNLEMLARRATRPGGTLKDAA